MRKLLIAAFAAVMCAGCSARVGDFTLASTKNVELARAGDLKRGTTRVKGEDMVAWILAPLGQPSIKTAMDKAIEQTPGAVALSDAVVMSHANVFLMLFGNYGYSVEGTPLIDQKLVTK